MNAADLYKNQIPNGWTRIDMLLALYDAIVDSLSSAEEAQAGRDEPRLSREMLRAQRLILGIVAGIDPNCHDIAKPLERLCHFVVERINQLDFAAARHIFSILKESFEEIAEEARNLEHSGEIPALEEDNALNMTA